MSTHQQQSVSVPGILSLQFFIGDWEASGTFFATPFSTEKPIRRSIEVAPVLAGSRIRTTTADKATVDNPTPLEATYRWGADGATDQLVAYLFDGSGGRAQQTSAGCTDDRLVFRGPMTNGGMTLPLRDTFVRVGPDACERLGEVDLDRAGFRSTRNWLRRRCTATQKAPWSSHDQTT